MIYFDNAATSYPKPPEVFDVMTTFMKERGGNPGRSGHRMATGAEATMEEGRNLFAKFFGLKEPKRVVYTLNCTDALNMAIKGVLREGDHAISSMIEHNSINRPLQKMNDDHVISLSRVGPDASGAWTVDEVLAALTPKTKLVALTHCSNVLGVICPIAELGKVLREKRPDVYFLVDLAQTAGVIPLDLEAACVDFAAVAGHKGTYGPTGTGALLIGARVKTDDFLAWREGGTGGDSSTPHQPKDLPYFLEGGTPNSMGIAGMMSGVRFIQKQKPNAIIDHEQKLLKRIIEGLSEDKRFTLYGTKDASKKAGVLSLTIKDRDVAETASILDQAFEICVRPGLHCSPYAHKAIGTFPQGGALRLSPGFFSTEDEVDQVVIALKEIAG